MNVQWDMHRGLSEILNHDEQSTPLLGTDMYTKLQTKCRISCWYWRLKSICQTFLHNHCPNTIDISTVVMLVFCLCCFNTGFFISLWNWLMPQLYEDCNDYIFQQHGSLAHYKHVRGYLNQSLPQRWIRCTGKEDDLLTWWPPQYPHLTPCDFFCWGFVKDTLCLHPR